MNAETGEPVIGEWDHAGESDGCTYAMWRSIMAGVQANRLHRGMKKNETSGSAAEELRSRGYLFSGYLRCGRLNDFDEVCYSKLSGNKSTGKNAKYGDYYRCGDPNCKGVGRRVAPVDRHLEGLALAYLEKNFAGSEAKVIPWRGEARLASLRKQRKDVEDSVVSGTTEWGDVHDILTRLARTIEALEQEERDHLTSERRRNMLHGWSRAKWEGMELSERRAALGQVFTSVVVLPVPVGVSDKAPFDPALLKVTWRKAGNELVQDPPRLTSD